MFFSLKGRTCVSGLPLQNKDIVLRQCVATGSDLLLGEELVALPCGA
jgi:hypothetical protein